MRRGRPSAAPSSQAAAPKSQAAAPKPSVSPVRVTKGDPFAALDAKAATLSADELSARFPTLDQFSILHDQGTRFSFEDAQAAAGASSVPASPEAQKSKDLNQRVAERLADDAFVSSPPTTAKATPQAAAAAATAAVAAGKVSPTTGISKSVSEPMHPRNRLPGRLNASPERHTKPAVPSPQKASEMSRASAIISSTPELQAISAQREQKPKMVSTGTMTSPSPTPPPPSSSVDIPSRASQYQVFRFPPADHQNPMRSSSLPRKQYQDASGGGPAEYGQSPSPQLRTQAQAAHIRHPSSSRPSLEGQRPNLDSLEPVSASVPSLPPRPRPTSTYLESNLDYLREREVSGGSGNGGGNAGGGSSGRPMLSPGQPSPKYGNSDFRAPSVSPRPDLNSNNLWDEAHIESNVDYLRSMEEQPDNKRDRGIAKASGGKRSSMTALSGTKNILAGKFGDAFKRFETSTGGSGGGNGSSHNNSSAAAPGPSRTPSPLKQFERNDSSYGGGGGGGYHDEPYDDNEQALEVTDDMPPEMRREIERRRLSMEERRVAAAAAEYRQRIARVDTGSTISRTTTNSSGAPVPPMPLPKSLPKSIGGVSRAVSIQNRVQNLLSEAKSSAPATRTASGYGHFTDDGSSTGGGGGASDSSARSTPVPNAGSSSSAGRGSFNERPEVHRKPVLVGRASIPLSDAQQRGGGGGAPPPKPSAKPKPMHLNKPLPLIGKSNNEARPGSPTVSYPPSRPVNARDRPPSNKSGASASQASLMAVDLPGQPVLEGMSMQDRDDYIRDFTRRFPSLTTIEMVERDLSAEDAHRR